MGDATSNNSSASGDDDDSEKRLQNGQKSVENTELSENVNAVPEIAEVSSPAGESSSNDNNLSFLRRISQGSRFPGRRRRRSVFLTFRARPRQRQPFTQPPANQNASRPPQPPRYYASQVTPDQHRPEIIRSPEHRPSPPDEPQGQPRESQEVETTQPRPSRNYQIVRSSFPWFSGGTFSDTPFLFNNYSYWAPYPETVPSNVLPCLAHLYQADSLFIIQQINFLELMFWGYFDVPNFYLIQNRSGQIIYYVYETTNLCMNSCCGDSRGFQLHVMDMYNNEVIYMNRPCGCTNFACCYPVMEVYSPPLVPVGAITQVYNAGKHEFAVVDADENLIFRIYGPLCFNFCCCCFEVDFTIHAIDKQETEVGIIRREWGGFVRTFLAESDMFGITFPKDLDVRIKAVFLGALFFIEYLYFEDR